MSPFPIAVRVDGLADDLDAGVRKLDERRMDVVQLEQRNGINGPRGDDSSVTAATTTRTASTLRPWMGEPCAGCVAVELIICPTVIFAPGVSC